MNKFLEDDVDALVGVPSNVPPTTLVGLSLELLRSGGFQVFLRRLWDQFRTTLPVESPYASVTWSKTETAVVLVQTLYPRVLRRVKSWQNRGAASIEAYIRSLSRALSPASTRRCPIAIENCPPILFNSYVDWCRLVGRPVPIVSVSFDAELL